MGQILNGIFSDLIALTGSGYALRQLGNQVRAASLAKASEGLPALQGFTQALTKKKSVQSSVELKKGPQK